MTEWLTAGWLPALGFFAAGIVLLTMGAEALVGVSQTIAARAGLSPLVVGLTIVAFSTSAPELVASLVAAWQGSPNLAMGNVLGSNIANIGLVLGIAAVVRRLVVHRRVVRVDTPLALILTMVLVVFVFDGEIEQWEGGILFAGIILYSTWRVRSADSLLDPGDESQIVEHQMNVSNLSLGAILILSIGSLSTGAYLFVEGGQHLAEILGVPERVIGLTVMALGTSLPEVATVISAARKNMFDLVAGTVVGSNIFNILSVVGLTALVFPLKGLEITRVDLAVFAGSAVVLLVVMLSMRSISRLVGAALTASYLAYVVYLY